MSPAPALRLVVLLVAALALLTACDGFSGLPPADPEAQRTYDLYLDKPTRAAYAAFRKANGQAAARHGDEHDAVGIRYQVRALEVQAIEAADARDPELAQLVIERVDEIEAEDYFEFYEERLPGSEARFRAARARAARLSQ